MSPLPFTTNGSRSLLTQVIGLLEDHLHLAHAEYQYESTEAKRRLLGLAMAVLSGIFALVFIQGAVIVGFWHAGLPLYAIFILFAVLWLGAAYGCYMRLTRRDAAAGEAFEASREETRKTVQWIHENFL